MDSSVIPAAILALALSTAPNPPAPGACDATDLMPAFWAYWDAAKGLPRAEQVRLFQKRLMGAHAAVYGGVFKSVPKPVPQIVGESLDGMPATEAGIAELGGNPIIVDTQNTHFGRGESLADAGRLRTIGQRHQHLAGARLVAAFEAHLVAHFHLIEDVAGVRATGDAPDVQLDVAKVFIGGGVRAGADIHQFAVRVVRGEQQRAQHVGVAGAG